MSLDLGIIINNIAAPIVVGAPVRDSDNKIVDFKIRFINDDFKAAAGHVLQDSKTFNGFSPRIVSSVPWFQMAVNTVEGKQLYNETYFSPSTKCYYNIKMNYVKEEDLVVVTFIDITSELQNTVIHKFLRQYSIDYDNKKINDIASFIRDTQLSKSGKTISLTKDKWLFVNTKEIKIITKNTVEFKEIPVTKVGNYNINEYIFSIEEHNTTPERFPCDEENMAYVNIPNLQNLCIRQRKNGDVIQPLGIKGTQKLKKFLNEKKVPKHEKDSLIFLCKDNEILWAPGFGISDKIKVVTTPTHVIKLRKEAMKNN